MNFAQLVVPALRNDVTTYVGTPPNKYSRFEATTPPLYPTYSLHPFPLPLPSCT
jgi:hypothetical protein